MNERRIKVNLVQRLSSERRRLGISRSLLARLLKTSESVIYRWETGLRSPDPRSRREILKFLKTVEAIQQEIHRQEGEDE